MQLTTHMFENKSREFWRRSIEQMLEDGNLMINRRPDEEGKERTWMDGDGLGVLCSTSSWMSFRNAVVSTLDEINRGLISRRDTPAIARSIAEKMKFKTPRIVVGRLVAAA